MSRRAPAPGIRPTPATHCPGGVCGTGPSLPPFGYVQPTTLSSVFPRGGPTAGGTSILLRGHGFRGFDPGALCEFGALLGPVEFGSSQATAWAEGGGRLRDDAWRDDLRNTVALNCTAAWSKHLWQGSSSPPAPPQGARPLGAQPPPRVLERAASTAAHFTACDHPGTAPPMPMAEHTAVRARLSPSLRAASSVRFRYYDEPQVRILGLGVGLGVRRCAANPNPDPAPYRRCASSSPPAARRQGARASRCGAHDSLTQTLPLTQTLTLTPTPNLNPSQVRGAGFGPYVELAGLALCRFGSQAGLRL